MAEKSHNDTFVSELSKTVIDSLILVWIVAGIILFFLTIIPLILSDDAVMKLSRHFRHSHEQEQRCLLCGMTRGYILMSKGQGSAAFKVNPCAPWLYAGSVINGIGVFFYIGKLLGIYQRVKNLLQKL